MKKKVIASLVIGVPVVVWLLFGFFGIQALFSDKVVHEVVPEIVQQNITTTSSSLIKVDPATTRVLARGKFAQGDSTYTITGQTVITEQNGVRTLSLVDFEVTNGPDLFVYIVSASTSKNSEVKDAVRAQQFVTIEMLKGNKGNQSYVIPADIVIDDKSLVSIWCRRFSRNFGAADLNLIK